MTVDDLRTALTMTQASLSSGGGLVAMHSRAPVPEHRRDDVHDVLRAVDGLESVAAYQAPDTCRGVFTHVPPAVRPVQTNGLRR
jgi:hypothetical protein